MKPSRIPLLGLRLLAGTLHLASATLDSTLTLAELTVDRLFSEPAPAWEQWLTTLESDAFIDRDSSDGPPEALAR